MLGSALTRVAMKNGIDVLLIANPDSSRLDSLKRDLHIEEDAHAEGGGVSSDGSEGNERGNVSGNARGQGPVSICLCSMSDYGELAFNIENGVEKGTAFKKPYDAFIHFAWRGTYGRSRDDEALQKDNIRNTNDAVCLAASLGCECFIGVGSQAECGPLLTPFAADTPCNPITGYGKAKLEACAQSKKLAHDLGMRHIWARVGSAYGPGDNLRTCMMQAIAHAISGEAFPCTPGEQLWDYIYCEDAARAIFAMAQSGKDGSIYPVGSGNVKPLKDYISLACSIANPCFSPDFGALEYPSGQAMFLCADISQLKADTGFGPSVRFEDGIASTIEWYCHGKNVSL